MPATPAEIHLVLPQVMPDGPVTAIPADCPAGTVFNVAVIVPRTPTFKVDEVIVKVGDAACA
jgi:hypothetical protein